MESSESIEGTPLASSVQAALINAIDLQPVQLRAPSATPWNAAAPPEQPVEMVENPGLAPAKELLEKTRFTTLANVTQELPPFDNGWFDGLQRTTERACIVGLTWPDGARALVFLTRKERSFEPSPARGSSNYRRATGDPQRFAGDAMYVINNKNKPQPSRTARTTEGQARAGEF